MTPVEFCYWLRGSTEMHPVAQPTPEQWAMIREHAGLATSDLSPAPISIACDRFAQWIHGFAQLAIEGPSPDQWLIIQERLRQVFIKVTSTPAFRLDNSGLRTLELRQEDRIAELLREQNYPLLHTATC
jgi:hypothetical protein